MTKLYIVSSFVIRNSFGDGDEFLEYFLDEEEAKNHAEDEWYHLTDKEKKHTRVEVNYINLDMDVTKEDLENRSEELNEAIGEKLIEGLYGVMECKD